MAGTTVNRLSFGYPNNVDLFLLKTFAVFLLDSLRSVVVSITHPMCTKYDSMRSRPLKMFRVMLQCVCGPQDRFAVSSGVLQQYLNLLIPCLYVNVYPLCVDIRT